MINEINLWRRVLLTVWLKLSSKYPLPETMTTLKVGLQFGQIGRANERTDIPLVEIDVN